MAFFAIGGFAVSCTAQSITPDEPQKRELSLTLKTAEASRLSGSDWVTVTAPGEWTLGFEETTSWATLSTASGKGNKANIVLSWDLNPKDESRFCTLVLTDGNDTFRTTFKQLGKEKASLVPDEIQAWMEIPKVDDNLYFFTHPMTINGKQYRNYSFGWDVEDLVARWVAYPLNNELIGGNTGRTDAWGLDPKVPREYQPVIFSAFRSFGARGHQIPSADRQIVTYNKETFYGTNMTPQDYYFNSGTWAALEKYVRDRSASFDTLYVVTGCTVAGSTKKAYDNDGKAVTVPTGYFKALLGYKKSKTVGNTGSQGGYTATGFYFKNQNIYSGYQSQRMTIDELEKMVDIDFFVNLIPVVGESMAAKIESTDDSWWNK